MDKRYLKLIEDLEKLSSYEYIKYRANQALKYGFKPENYYDIKINDVSVAKALTLEGKNIFGYVMIFIEEDHRGKGYYEKIYKEKFFDRMILTFSNCNISEFLTKKNLPFFLIDVEFSTSYAEVMHFYGTDKAKRSQVNLMNHIEEGIAILQHLGCDKDTIDAYCLHPIFQGDNEVIDAFSKRCARNPTPF